MRGARLAQQKKEVADQKAQVKQLVVGAAGAGSPRRSPRLRHQLGGHQRRPLRRPAARHADGRTASAVVQSEDDGLVNDLAEARPAAVVLRVSGEETGEEGGSCVERQGLLAVRHRLRSAYDTDRTSMLESFLSLGQTSLDMLTLR